MKHLETYEKSSLKSGDAVFAVIRCMLGIILLWKAVDFFMHRELLLDIISDAGVLWFAPVLWAHYVILAHFFGGFCLLVGVATRFSCIIQLPILLGAVFYVHLPRLLQMDVLSSLDEMNLAIFTLVLLLFYSIRGAGVYSMDYHTIYDEEHEDEAHPHARHGHKIHQ